MGQDTFYSDLHSKLASHKGGSTATVERGNWGDKGNNSGNAFNKPIMEWGKALSEMAPAQRQIAKMGAMAIAEKLGTGDLTSLLVTSVSQRDSFIRNEETPLLNFMDSFGLDFEVMDWAYRIVERRMMSPASRFNPESSPLTTTSKATARTEKYNTLAFWGDPIRNSIVSQNMVRNQGGPNVKQQDMDAEMLAIRQAKEYDFFNGIEQKSFAPQNTPVVGGLISRTFTNNINASGANLTDGELSQGLSAVGAVTGYNAFTKVIFTDAAQAGAVRTLEIGRYNGNNPMAFWQYNQILSKQFAQYNVPYDQIYTPAVGPAAPVIHTPYLPVGYAIALPASRDYVPQQAKFRIGGEYGPWSLVRVQYEMFDTEFVFDGATLDDPGEELRVVWYNSL